MSVSHPNTDNTPNVENTPHHPQEDPNTTARRSIDFTDMLKMGSKPFSDFIMTSYEDSEPNAHSNRSSNSNGGSIPVIVCSTDEKNHDSKHIVINNTNANIFNTIANSLISNGSKKQSGKKLSNKSNASSKKESTSRRATEGKTTNDTNDIDLNADSSSTNIPKSPQIPAVTFNTDSFGVSFLSSLENSQGTVQLEASANTMLNPTGSAIKAEDLNSDQENLMGNYSDSSARNFTPRVEFIIDAAKLKKLDRKILNYSSTELPERMSEYSNVSRYSNTSRFSALLISADKHHILEENLRHSGNDSRPLFDDSRGTVEENYLNGPRTYHGRLRGSDDFQEELDAFLPIDPDLDYIEPEYSECSTIPEWAEWWKQREALRRQANKKTLAEIVKKRVFSRAGAFVTFVIIFLIGIGYLIGKFVISKYFCHSDVDVENISDNNDSKSADVLEVVHKGSKHENGLPILTEEDIGSVINSSRTDDDDFEDNEYCCSQLSTDSRKAVGASILTGVGVIVAAVTVPYCCDSTPEMWCSHVLGPCCSACCADLASKMAQGGTSLVFNGLKTGAVDGAPETDSGSIPEPKEKAPKMIQRVFRGHGARKNKSLREKGQNGTSNKQPMCAVDGDNQDTHENQEQLDNEATVQGRDNPLSSHINEEASATKIQTAYRRHSTPKILEIPLEILDADTFGYGRGYEKLKEDTIKSLTGTSLSVICDKIYA